MNLERSNQVNKASESNAFLSKGILQRKCDCGNHTKSGEECAACSNKKLNKPLQTKLEIGDANDRYEQEADRVAEQVVQMPKQNNSDANEYLHTIPMVQKRISDTHNNVSEVPLIVHDALSSTGRPLEQSALGFMGPRLNYDFSEVRIHDNREAQLSASAINANAYTVGSDIVFGKGQYAPGTQSGNRLLAHELTHVVQQSNVSQSTVQRDLAIEPPNPNVDGRVLSATEIADAITFNNRVLGAMPNGAAIIELIRDVIGVAPLPAVVDQAFVNGVVDWQASFGLTQDGKLGPTTARPLFREIGAEGVGRGQVQTAPRYNPAGPINVPRAGARTAPFTFTAAFKSDPANNIYPSCCEIRQDLQWDATFRAASIAAGNGTVPTANFPAAAPANTWIEDRDANGRYGHRSGPFTDPGAGDQYLDSARRNQAFGHRYSGSDTPTGFAADRGSWSFRLRVIDVCNGNALLATSPTLVVNWL